LVLDPERPIARAPVPAEFYPAPGSILFDERTVRNGVTLAASSALTTLASFTVPSGTWGIFKGFGQGVAASAAWSNIEWGIQIDGVRLNGYETIYDQISTLTRPVFLFRPLAGGDVIQLVARNLSLSTGYVVYGRILGWYYLGVRPIEQEFYDFYHGGLF
jgi:hypothetical protein